MKKCVLKEKGDLWAEVHGKLCGRMKLRQKCEKYKWDGLCSVYVDGVRQSCHFTEVTVTLPSDLFWDCSGVLSGTASCSDSACCVPLC